MRVFERIYLGEKTIDDTEWVQRMLESSLSKDFIARGTKVLGKISGGSAGKDQKADIAGLLVSAFARKSEEPDV